MYDADTIGAIAGGLAALHYGYKNIPAQWKDVIINEIVALCENMGEVTDEM